MTTRPSFLCGLLTGIALVLIAASARGIGADVWTARAARRTGGRRRVSHPTRRIDAIVQAFERGRRQALAR